jgi:hypothetical protein
MAIGTVDAVATFCDATRANDVDRIVSTLAPDVELLSPLSGRMVFRGRDDLRVLLGAVYGGLSNSDLAGDHRRGHDPGGRQRRTDRGCHDHRRDGARARRSRADREDPPHLRPWLAITLFALLLGPKIARRPGVLRRALRR